MDKVFIDAIKNKNVNKEAFLQTFKLLKKLKWRRKIFAGAITGLAMRAETLAILFLEMARVLALMAKKKAAFLAFEEAN